ncbi:NAD(P)/FAD-dependent oxidoreductase [Luteolibacter pohnpeiensis]|uniref:NADH:ubiquinone reductase (non-electrogenic) n=1 Tax=Luteolibacter pohnpeiensis TaxID=454153 RepID=A0A934S3R1_9BACT|nr:NAD(P)/FAD-dependent oxidoreductase [Luteolibacter pohnpeiensis]MBK1881353.1 NAD(P)/FAD-dependent oxidoreductase [Luteolibacter pohnpeiensis]
MSSPTGATTRFPKKVLIIGGGFAGLECAQTLANDNRFAVTLIDRTNHHLFQPLLYQVATASLAAPDIARSIRQILADAKNVTVLMDEIDNIEPDKKRAFGKSGASYEYDYLLLSVGARTGYFGNDHWAEHTMGLKSLSDAQVIRRTVLSNLERAELTTNEAERAKLMTVAIIGGGPTGVELAGAFSDLVHKSLKSNFRRIDTSKLRVLLIEGMPNILSMYPQDQIDYARGHLESIGVEVITGKIVTDVQPGLLKFKDDTTVEAAAIIWAAGVAANPLSKCLGVETDRAGRITPNPDLSIPGRSDVFVAGDLTFMKDVDSKPVPGVAPAASQMGRHVGKLLKEEMRMMKKGFDEAKRTSLRPNFRYLDKGMMAIIGKNHAVVKAGKLKLTGYPAWAAWLFIHILFLVGFRNKLAVLLGWASSYLRNTPEARIIAHPPTTVPPNLNQP